MYGVLYTAYSLYNVQSVMRIGTCIEMLEQCESDDEFGEYRL